MILSDELLEEAARRLYETSQRKAWFELEPVGQEAYRFIVRNLAAEIMPGERTPDDIETFIRWMADPFYIDRERERS